MQQRRRMRKLIAFIMLSLGRKHGHALSVDDQHFAQNLARGLSSPLPFLERDWSGRIT